MYTADNIIQEAAMALSKFGKFIKLTDEDVVAGITQDQRSHRIDKYC